MQGAASLPPPTAIDPSPQLSEEIADRAAYCASKAGVIGLTRAIAVDHATAGVRAVAICPGTVESEWITKILANHPDPTAAHERCLSASSTA